MNEQKFIELFSSVSEMYEKDPSPFVIDLWFNALCNYSFRSVSKAFSIHIKNADSGKFMPKPADIIKIIDGSPSDNAYIAWSKARDAISRVGSYETVAFDDPIIHLVIEDMGGWIKLGGMFEKDEPFKSKEFRERYQSYKNCGDIPSYPAKLCGIHEGENYSNDLIDHIHEPVLIGDIDSAQLTLKQGSNRPSLQITNLGSLKKIEFKEIEE